MPKITKDTKKHILIVLIIFTIGFVLHFLSKRDYVNFAGYNTFLDIYRTIIYMIVFLLWGLSLRTRILQRQERVYAMLFASLLVFWIGVRGIKYYVTTSINVNRYLWYLYYIPFLYIACLLFLTALCVDKPENYRTSAKLKLVFIPTAILFLLVITNDFHQLVFTFPTTPFSDLNNGQGIVYYFVHGWRYLLEFAALIIVTKKCRIPESKKLIWLPVFLSVLILTYDILYLFRVKFLFAFLNDATVVNSFGIMAIVESCIQCRLISLNTHYDVLMKITSVPIKVLDSNGNVIEATESFDEKSDMRISKKEITGGTVLWQEDVTELARLTEQLNENNETLNEYNDILRERFEQKEKKARLEQKNRLYDNLQNETADQIEKLSRLIRRIENCDDDKTARVLLKKVVIMGAYLKRKSNLTLIAGEEGIVPAAELERAFVESINILNSSNVHCTLELGIDGNVSAEIMKLYDCFERIVETCWDDMFALMINVSSEDENIVMRISVGTEVDLSNIWEGAEALKDEDGIWYVKLSQKNDYKGSL